MLFVGNFQIKNRNMTCGYRCRKFTNARKSLHAASAVFFWKFLIKLQYKAFQFAIVIYNSIRQFTKVNMKVLHGRKR